MALPIQAAPKHRCILPSNGKEIEYRPFLVKEQRNLLLIKEDSDDATTVEGIINLLEQVVYTELNYKDLPTYDVEYLFLKVRSKSVGETVTIQAPCQVNSEHAPIPVKVNLDSVIVDNLSDTVDKKIMLTTTMGVVMKHPTVGDASKLSLGDNDEMDTLNMLSKCIVQVFTDTEVFEMSETPDSEIREFVDSLTFPQIELVSEFFEKMPVLRTTVDYKCPSCENAQSLVLEGIQSFF